MEANIKAAKKVAGVTALVTLFMVALGGYVRATGAGLACPDWPLCFGKLVPKAELGIAGVPQEYYHRVTAILVTAGILALVLIAFKIREHSPRLFTASKVLSITLLIQIVLGGLTVLMKLNSFIVTSHLFFGTVILQLLALIALESRKPSVTTSNKGQTQLVLTSALVFFQIVLGGFVGTSGASMACPDVPWCQGQILPDNYTGQHVVHMLHRANGMLLLLVSFLLIFLVKKDWAVKRGHLIGMFVTMLFQVSLGFSNVLRGIPVSETVTHLVLAQLLLFGYLVPTKKALGIKFFGSNER